MYPTRYTGRILVRLPASSVIDMARDIPKTAVTANTQSPARQWPARVIQAAKAQGWMVCHYPRSRGWQAAVTGHRGAPDLLLARRGVVLLVSLRPKSGWPHQYQQLWLRHIGDEIGQTWLPEDWPRALEILRTGRVNPSTDKQPAADWLAKCG